MSLTDKDREWIADLIATANERVYRSIKDNALSELATDVRAGFASLDRQLDDLHGVLNGVSADVEYLKGRVDP